MTEICNQPNWEHKVANITHNESTHGKEKSMPTFVRKKDFKD